MASHKAALIYKQEDLKKLKILSVQGLDYSSNTFLITNFPSTWTDTEEMKSHCRPYSSILLLSNKILSVRDLS